MNYRLAMLDVDGTLKTAGDWNPGAEELLDLLRSHGITVALCSGRTSASMTWLGDRVPHAAFVAANSGSTVWERTDDEWTLLAHRSLGAEQVSEIVATAEAAGIEVWAHTERDWIARERTPRVQRDESFVGDTALLEDAAGRDDVGKLLLLSSHPSHEPVARSLAALPGVAAVSSSEIFMDLVPEASAAGKGGDVLVDRLGIGWDEVIAIGDGENDSGMVSQAGLGIAISPLSVEALAPARPGQVRRGAADTAGALAALRDVLD